MEGGGDQDLGLESRSVFPALQANGLDGGKGLTSWMFFWNTESFPSLSSVTINLIYKRLSQIPHIEGQGRHSKEERVMEIMGGGAGVSDDRMGNILMAVLFSPLLHTELVLDRT